MNLQVLLKSKTFWLNLAAIFTAIGGYFGGEVQMTGLLVVVGQAASNIFLRDAMANPTKLPPTN